jgi:hypothetical protein
LIPIRCTEKTTLPVEVLATIHLPKNRRINIDRALESILDDLGGGEHVDALFLRIYRATK